MLAQRPFGLVLFARGSVLRDGDDTSRDRLLSEMLAEVGLASASLDLTTSEEGRIDEHHLAWTDVHLLAGRLVITIDWLGQWAATRGLPIGCVATGGGASVALVAACERSSALRAVVSWNGRLDLIAAVLASVTTPTLLLVGEEQTDCLAINRRAVAQLAAPDKELRIVPRSSNLSDGATELGEVARLARDWFTRYLGPANRRPTVASSDARR